MGEEKDSYSAYLISMIAKAKYGISQIPSESNPIWEKDGRERNPIRKMMEEIEIPSGR